MNTAARALQVLQQMTPEKVASFPTVQAAARAAQESAEIEVWAALGEAYGAMGAAFQRIHSLPRTEDSAIADRLGRARGRIERLKAAREAK